MPTPLQNKVFDELKVGDSATITKTLTKQDIEIFAVVTGDINPAHLDESFAKKDIFKKIVGHGMWGGTLISTILGTILPGPGTIYLEQTLKFLKPIGVDDKVSITVTVKEKIEVGNRARLSCTCINQLGQEVMTGEALVIVPTQKIS